MSKWAVNLFLQALPFFFFFFLCLLSPILYKKEMRFLHFSLAVPSDLIISVDVQIRHNICANLACSALTC